METLDHAITAETCTRLNESSRTLHGRKDHRIIPFDAAVAVAVAAAAAAATVVVNDDGNGDSGDYPRDLFFVILSSWEQ